MRQTNKPRLLRRLLRICCALALLTALLPPANLLSMRAPQPPIISKEDQTKSHDTGSHVVRVRLAGMIVRMAVDPLARSPLDLPLQARTIPLASLAALAPDRVRAASPRTVAVKISPTTAPSPARIALETPDEPKKPAARRAADRPAPETTAPHSTMAAFAQGASILAVGDSLSIGLADSLEKRLGKIPGVAFAKSGKVSSGLARPDFYDWEKRLEELAQLHVPDLTVIMIATNDNKSLRAPSGKVIAFGATGWDAEYSRRVQNLLDIVRSHNPKARIFWMGAPVMADASLDRDVKAIQTVIKAQLSKNANAWFVDADKTLADASGHFAQFLPSPRATGKTVRIRYGDGVHITPAGADLLAETCLAAMSSQVNLAALTRPGRRALTEIAEK